MNHKQQIHQWIKTFTPLDTVVDMTAGNGHDTLFLASLATHVMAVDIQAQAIEQTQLRCQNYDNITYHHHSNAIPFLKQHVDGLMYNLGYLPGSDKTITTTLETTLKSLELALPYVRNFISISCYRKHEGGNQEYLGVKDFVETHFNNYQILEYDTELSPVSFLITL